MSSVTIRPARPGRPSSPSASRMPRSESCRASARSRSVRLHNLSLAVVRRQFCPGARLHGAFTVAGRGEIDFAVAGLPDCFPTPSATIQSTTQPFTVTGGSGAYAGASGSGDVEHAGTPRLAGTHGRDRWEGTVAVVGLEFDVTPPVITGAVGKTARALRGARSVRVVYRVAAADAVDGARAVRCAPPSGSRFRVGRTRVTCSAADTSGNVATRSFVVVVRRGR